jgi:hypothetical protein
MESHTTEHQKPVDSAAAARSISKFASILGDHTTLTQTARSSAVVPRSLGVWRLPAPPTFSSLERSSSSSGISPTSDLPSAVSFSGARAASVFDFSPSPSLAPHAVLRLCYHTVTHPRFCFRSHSLSSSSTRRDWSRRSSATCMRFISLWPPAQTCRRPRLQLNCAGDLRGRRIAPSFASRFCCIIRACSCATASPSAFESHRLYSARTRS